MNGIFAEKDYKSQLEGLCVVEVSGESCANCVTLMPVLESIVRARGDLKFVHVEANEQTAALMEEWEIDRVPTVLLVENGEIFARCHGYQPEEILELWIDAKVEERRKA